METPEADSVAAAKTLMDEFAEGTGLTKGGEEKQNRYLWTDAFAVQNFLALSSHTGDDTYKDLARHLIEKVHYTLGRFAPADSRTGWISGLGEEEGRKHPTAGGLRIGKKQPERKKTEPRDSQREWSRDGQYYHYHTRWISALLHAAQYLENDRDKLVENAAELSLAGKHFLRSTNEHLHLFWKMSVDLSYPQVLSMGAHDRLDGYLTALTCRRLTGDAFDFSEYLLQLEALCEGKNWQTSDPLGLGGLLLNTVRSAQLAADVDLPASVSPQTLFDDALKGLKSYAVQADHSSSPAYRLAFRECGLSLGLRVADSRRDILEDNGLESGKLDDRLYLADEIEHFWSKRENKDNPTYIDHVHINHVSLASSLLAQAESAFFSAPGFGEMNTISRQ
ncbi:hypothetical protein [Rhodohalobacter mucosus]|uniref:Uncharacterized protein n=1 Tax=Rhodohalobacter mucosus TaxID=2079485 RepID=A0A316TVH7_9BACT|nr:hypothetical protein [Rhodohalobacter mucosus]PWN06482.1 hypothetical protein DDZ15_08140 [Rhodohalobacter mucosus]